MAQHVVTGLQEKERYIFFSFPHIAIDASGKVGAISRPGRPGESCACGAMAGALGTFKAQGLSDGLKAQDGAMGCISGPTFGSAASFDLVHDFLCHQEDRRLTYSYSSNVSSSMEISQRR